MHLSEILPKRQTFGENNWPDQGPQPQATRAQGSYRKIKVLQLSLPSGTFLILNTPSCYLYRFQIRACRHDDIYAILLAGTAPHVYPRDL